MKAIAQLLVHFNWTWVGLLLCERDYGRFAAEGLLRELRGTKVCVAYQETIPLVYNQIRVQEIMQVECKKHLPQVCFFKVRVYLLLKAGYHLIIFAIVFPLKLIVPSQPFSLSR